jgi:hypothetical protein
MVNWGMVEGRHRQGRGWWLSRTVGVEDAGAPLSFDEAVGVQIDLSGGCHQLSSVHDLHRGVGS